MALQMCVCVQLESLGVCPPRENLLCRPFILNNAVTYLHEAISDHLSCL